MGVEVNRFDVCLVRLDPTIGNEIKKTRPAIVVSPDEINQHWSPLVIVPLTSKIREIDFRVKLVFQGIAGQAAIDQIKAVDRKRIVKKLGSLSPRDANNLQNGINLFFRKEG
ncbi:MAG: type II toxin-antitoxin system PemK/MazF family toxin [Cyclobacteriaceae bacterium]